MGARNDDEMFDGMFDDLEAIVSGAGYLATPLRATVDAYEHIIRQPNNEPTDAASRSTPAPVESSHEQLDSDESGAYDNRVAWAGAQFEEPYFTNPMQWTDQPRTDLTAEPNALGVHQLVNAANQASGSFPLHPSMPGSPDFWTTSSSAHSIFTWDLIDNFDSVLQTSHINHDINTAPTISPPGSPQRSFRAAIGQAVASHQSRSRSEPVSQLRPHACTHLGCKADFRRLNELKRHQRYHTPMEARPHGCSLCSSRFLFPRELVRHMTRHGRQYCLTRYFCPHVECKFARTGFARKDHLDRHLRSQHPELTPPTGVSSSVKTEEQESVDSVVWP